MYGHAEKGDREKPVIIEANSATLDQKAQVSIFTGNVILTQGTMCLLASKVILREDAPNSHYAEGSGIPVKFKQKMDNSPNYLEAEAQRFNYDGKTGILRLYDKAWVKRGGDEVRSDIIIYDTIQETYEAQAKKEGRVNITITPKQENKPQVDKSNGKANQSAAHKKISSVPNESAGQ